MIEDQLAGLAAVAPIEIEHLVELPRDRVHRAARLDTLAGQPVVFDEAQDRGLIDQAMVDEIALGERRDDEERQSIAVTAPTPRRAAECAFQRGRRRRPVLL